MKVKIETKLSVDGGEAVAPHVAGWYRRPGTRAVAVVEFVHKERTEPAPGEDAEPTVIMRFGHIEVASTDDEADVLRRVQRGLYAARTAYGTLDDAGTLELDRATLKAAAGEILDLRAAHLTAGVKAWAGRARVAAGRSERATARELGRELEEIAVGLAALVDAAPGGE